MKLKTPLKLTTLGSLSLTLLLLACAPAPQSGPSDAEIADLTSVMGQEAETQDGLPQTLGGAAPVKAAPKVVKLEKAKVDLVNGAKWAVDECYTFVVGGISKDASDYSISGNYDGARLKATLTAQVERLAKECPAAEGEVAAALDQYFQPLKTYVEALTPQAEVKESNAIKSYASDYYNFFEIAE